MKTVTDYIEKQEQWREGLELLRQLCLSLGLKETVKWGAPVYMWNGKNVVGIMGFSSYFGIWFFEGANLTDPKGVLINAQEGKTKLLRQWRFSSVEEFKGQLSDVENYIREAMKLAETAKKRTPKRKPPLTFEELPSELREACLQDEELKEAFFQLSPSCQREYAEYIQEAKRQETRIRRLEKIIPLIKDKKGLHEKYQKR